MAQAMLVKQDTDAQEKNEADLEVFNDMMENAEIELDIAKVKMVEASAKLEKRDGDLRRMSDSMDKLTTHLGEQQKRLDAASKK